MKVLKSIKPYWVYLICEGIKTIEVGKTVPKSDRWNKSVAIYCSKDMRSFRRIPKKFREKYRPLLGKVVGEFVCRGIMGGDSTLLERQSCLTRLEIVKYAKGKRVYGWRIADLKIYDTPKELGEFWHECKNYDSGCECFSDICSIAENSGCHCGLTRLTKPPQSWCYVEELKS